MVIGDNEDEPTKNFERIQKALESEGFRVPPEPVTTVPGPPAVAVFMIPSAGTIGALETMLVEAVFDAHPELQECLLELHDCVEETEKWSETKKSKMLLHAAIATSCVEDPSSNLTNIWNKKGNPIPIDSDRFQTLADFLGSFRANVLV